MGIDVDKLLAETTKVVKQGRREDSRESGEEIQSNNQEKEKKGNTTIIIEEMVALQDRIEKTFRDLEERLNTKDKRVKELEDILREKEQEITELKELVTMFEEENEELQLQVERKNKVTDKINEINDTISEVEKVIKTQIKVGIVKKDMGIVLPQLNEKSVKRSSKMKDNYILDGELLQIVMKLKEIMEDKVGMVVYEPEYVRQTEIEYNGKVYHRGQQGYTKVLKYHLTHRITELKEIMDEGAILSINVESEEEDLVRGILREQFGENDILGTIDYSAKVGNREINYANVITINNIEMLPEFKIYTLGELNEKVKKNLYDRTTNDIEGVNEVEYIPKSIVEELINFRDVRDDIILGYGDTTGLIGQVVLEANKKDRGERTYILAGENRVKEEDKYRYIKEKRRITEATKEAFEEFYENNRVIADTMLNTDDYLSNGELINIGVNRMRKLNYGYRNKKGEYIEGHPHNMVYMKLEESVERNREDLEKGDREEVTKYVVGKYLMKYPLRTHTIVVVNDTTDLFEVEFYDILPKENIVVILVVNEEKEKEVKEVLKEQVRSKNMIVEVYERGK